MCLCLEAHKDQKDKGGYPYVFHPYHLAEQMEDEDTVTTALLHDVVEDTDYTLEDLERMGFPGRILEAIDLMTHRKDVPYLEYVALLKDNPIARKVKLADLRHNSDLTRLDHPDEKARKRIGKYRSAMEILQD